MSYTGQAITEIQEDRRDVHPVSLSSQRVEKQPPICCIASYYTIQCICVGEEAFLQGQAPSRHCQPAPEEVSARLGNVGSRRHK